MNISREEIAVALRECKRDNSGMGRKQLQQAQRACVVAYLKAHSDRIGGINPELQPVQNASTGWPVADAILENLESYPDYVQ